MNSDFIMNSTLFSNNKMERNKCFKKFVKIPSSWDKKENVKFDVLAADIIVFLATEDDTISGLLDTVDERIRKSSLLTNTFKVWR